VHIWGDFVGKEKNLIIIVCVVILAFSIIVTLDPFDDGEKIKGLELGNEIDNEMNVSMTENITENDVVYVSGRIENPENETSIYAGFFDSDNNLMNNTQVLENNTITFQDSEKGKYFKFYFGYKPDTGWEVDNYFVKIMKNDEEVEKIKFNIV